MNHFSKSLLLVLILAGSLVPSCFAQSAFEAVFGDNNEYADVVVDKVTTVDTLILQSGEKIRLIGIKGPALPRKEKVEQETKGEMGFVMQRSEDDADPVDPIEQQALDFVRELLEGNHVRLELDNLQKSDDHRTLAYVYLLKDNTLVNAEILRQGFANLSIRPPNTKYEDILRDAYRTAREERRGLQGQ